MTASAYPLAWPAGRPRTPANKRKYSRFTKSVQEPGGSWRSTRPLTLAEAVKRLLDETGRVNARHLVISTNVQLRLDGLPRSDQRKPDDPGVCVYFMHQGKEVAMPCDTYDTVEGNIAAVAAHIEATRAIERHGVATVAQMFSGFAALPPPQEEKRAAPWWEVLGLPKGTYSKEVIDAVFRDKAKKAHPDFGGTNEEMADLIRAKEEALKA